MLQLSLWFAMGIGAVVSALLVYVVLRFRDRPGQKGEPEQVHGSTKLEILWTLIPILILITVAVPTVKAAFSTDQHNVTDADAIMIKVTGNQWWWAFEYQNEKFTTANEMYIPKGKAVKLELTSADVIHSFWVPKLAGKTDVIPNRINKMWLKADDTGDYFGQCAEFCQTSHAKMRFHVKAVTQAEYDAWVKKQQAGASVPTDAAALAGKALFEGKDKTKANCLSCHTVDGTKAQGKVGPNLTNIGSRSTIAAGVLAKNEDNLRQWIRNPQSLKPGVKMVAHPNLSDEELNQIIAYLNSLK